MNDVYKVAGFVPLTQTLLMDQLGYIEAHPWLVADPNPFPRFHLFRRSRPQAQRCTGDPCICTNGIGCVTIPMELW